MEDEEEDIILQSRQMIPERDLSGLHGGMMDNPDMGGGSGVNYGGDIFGSSQVANASNSHNLGTQAEAAFNQQRVVVARLSREELEDRYLRLLEENVVIKKHACKQEDKIKKLATKLIRVLSDKKRLEMTGGGGGIHGAAGGGRRDVETEELIEDQQHKIRELERQNTHLKEKLMVAKQQLLAVTSGGRSGGSHNRRNIPRKSIGQGSQLGVGPPSPVPMQMQGQLQPTQQQLLSQQAHQLLEEAKNENRMLEDTVATLKEQVNIFEQEVEQIREQSKIKESNFEEEIAILKEQVKDRECQTVTENIELIRLQQDKKTKTGQITTLKSQLQGLEETLTKLKTEEQSLRRENANLNDQLQEEQKRTIALTKEVSVNASSKQALLESEVKARDLQRENAILRESNEKLLDSAYNVERERHFVASETALKVQVAQLESTLKADLSDKKMLTDSLAKERESYAKLEAEYKDLQSRYFSLKETVEGQEEKLQFFAKENSVSSNDLEEALLLLHNKQRTPFSENNSDIPSFLDKINQEDHQSDIKAELSELQVRHVEAVNELEKTRSLLKALAGINREQKHEVEALQNRLQQAKAEFQSQLSEYKKLLDMRAARIKKLELQLRETAYGQAQKLTERQLEKTTTVHTPSGQSLFEIHMLKAHLTKEILINLGSMEPKIFATWTFYDHSMQYTPVTVGPEAVFDCSAYYKIKLDDAFLDYLACTTVQVEVHLVMNKQDCKPIAQTELSLREVLDYPSNKLHGSVMLTSLSRNTLGNIENNQKVIGTLDYWFKLHTAAIHRIRLWQEHKAEVEKVIQTNLMKSEPCNESMLLREKGRQISTNQNAESMSFPQRGMGEFNSSVEPQPAPRVKPIPCKPFVRQERSKEIESTDKDSETSNLTDKRREIQDTGAKPYAPKASFDKSKDSLSNKVETNTGSERRSIENMDSKKNQANDGKSVEKSNMITAHLSKGAKSLRERTNQTAKSVDSNKSENSEKMKVQKKEHSPPPTQFKAAKNENLVSQEQNSECNSNSDNSPNEKDTDNADDLKQKQSLPVPKPRTSPSRKSTPPKAVKSQSSNKSGGATNESQNKDEDELENETKKMNKENIVLEKAEMEATSTDNEETGGGSSVSEESSAKDIDSKDEEDEPTEGNDEDEVLDASDVGEEEESTGEDSSEGEQGQSEENDDEENGDIDEYNDNDMADKEETHSHSTDQSADESSDDSKHNVKGNNLEKVSVSHLVDVHQRQQQESSINETSQDSEGVVMLKSPSTTRKHSSSKDKMAITIVEFKAAKGAKFLKNKNIDKLYVEYKFLDVPPEELETPSFPKPKVGGECFKFNFTKIIPVDRAIHSQRRRKLVKILTSEPSGDQAKDESAENSMLIFTLVSEPPEDKKDQDCEDVGVAKIDLKMILSTGQDIVDMAVDVFSSEVQSRVSRLLNTGNKPIGTLTISIEASEVFKSLRLK